MKCIFIGNPMLESNTKKVQNKIHFSAADNKAQNILIKGLYERYGSDLTVISINRNSKDRKVSKLDCGTKAILVKCIEKNRILYYLSILRNIYKEYKKLLKQYNNETIVTITWGPSIFYCLGPMLNKRKTKFIPFIVTSVEYPEYKGLFKIIANYNLKIMRKVDASITYVDASAQDYTNKPYHHTYYTLSDTQIDIATKFKKKINKGKINIGYSGQLTEVNGIDILLKVISVLPDNYVLNICGKGPLEKLVLEYQKKYKNKINYHGYLNIEETTKLQLNSDILIVIRPIINDVTEYYSKYAASAKLTEYLLSGNPIITNDIPCISEEIKKYLNLIPNCDVEIIVSEIKKVSKNLKKNVEGQKFAIETFNESYQNKKICEFIDDIIKE
ncbi:MAG: glycosyltransferase [Bacilli bacterium]|nr:glycosyltransferase [Bacilli bacterium]MDD3304939.1 glycosyltransferase [Bacilli bacterium]MDD4053961.1 glycosyltransferase [Bacilli bacterium]MDD4411427.1 glycosyltransferase [Bacilli bacterium]